MARRLELISAMVDEAVDPLAGRFLPDSSYDTVISGEDVDVFKPDGTPLLFFRAGALPAADAAAAASALRSAAAISNNRGLAAGHPEPGTPGGKETSVRYRKRRLDGTVSNTSYAVGVRSGLVGSIERDPRFPYCRQTAWTLEQRSEFAAALPVVRHLDGWFRDLAPERYAAQRDAAERVHPDFLIRGTAFSTITVNRNFRTAVHKDAGDFANGFGVLTAFSTGRYDGALFVFPKYRVAVDMRSRDVLLADVHEWHGNTAFAGRDGSYERLSLVLYLREGLLGCGSSAEELERARDARSL